MTQLSLDIRPRPHGAKRTFFRISASFQAGCDRFGARLVQYSVQGNHLHLLVEPDDARALGRSRKGISVRIARKLNALMDRRGAVFSDRYHSRILRTPLEVKRVLLYIVNNARRHAAQRGETRPSGWSDVFSSAPFFDGYREGPVSFPKPIIGPTPVACAKSWLVTRGWRRHGLVSIDDVPAG